MKILIIDDSYEKIDRIEDSLRRLSTDYSITTVHYFIDAKRILNVEKFDFIICDMQFPNRVGRGIELFSGIRILDHMNRYDITTPVVIASSDDTVNVLLEERGYGHIPTIKASSMYDLDSQLEPHLASCVEECVPEGIPMPGNERPYYRNGMNYVKAMVDVYNKIKPSKEPKYSGQSQEEKDDKLRKAELKREIKALKKLMNSRDHNLPYTSVINSTDSERLKKLQDEYRGLK